MKKSIVVVIVFGILIGGYFFIKSNKKEVVDLELQKKCNEMLALTRFSSESARDQFYQDCLRGNI